eukprot:1055746-Rhodomonas_salina.1
MTKALGFAKFDSCANDIIDAATAPTVGFEACLFVLSVQAGSTSLSPHAVRADLTVHHVSGGGGPRPHRGGGGGGGAGAAALRLLGSSNVSNNLPAASNLYMS